MTVIGVPYHLDEYLPGLDLPLSPDRVITADLPAEAGTWDRLARLYARVGAAVAASARDGQCPIVLSGDCTTALGTVAGLQQVAGQALGIVWFDAHGDVQTPETTASGYLGGMPLRLLTGYRPELIAARLGLRPVAEDAVILAGARDLDPPEVTYLSTVPIGRPALPDLAAASLPDLPLYVHVDFDVLDPAQLPGLRYPVPGGAAATDLAAALSMLLGTGRVAALGLACTWYPGHDAAAAIAAALPAELAGTP